MAGIFTHYSRTQKAEYSLSRPEIREKFVINDLNSLLQDIYRRFIALRDKESAKYYKVFDSVFATLHEKMKQVDKYYENYFGTVQFAGSHYDKLRITKPDEYDMDIVIRLPENPVYPGKTEVVIEEIAEAPGFVRLKMGAQFQNFACKDEGEMREVNQTAYRWLDDENYLRRSQFMNWFKSVVDKAMDLFECNELGQCNIDVEGKPYTLRVLRPTSRGPAYTLMIEDPQCGFKLDVDLVPALKFSEDYWPINEKYRLIPERCRKGYFIVVSKRVYGSGSLLDSERSWRLGMHMQEKELMHDACAMKQTIRLIKKLRDSQNMDAIASYYIKTIFFHEALAQAPDFWKKTDTELFIRMVKRFLHHLETKNLPYFWNPENNLIGNLTELTRYAKQLKRLIKVWEDPMMSEDKKVYQVAQFLLSQTDFKEYSRRILVKKLRV